MEVSSYRWNLDSCELKASEDESLPHRFVADPLEGTKRHCFEIVSRC